MNKDLNSALKDALVLVVITLVSGLFLGLVNMLTEEPIRLQKEQAVIDSCKAVFPNEEGFAQVAQHEADKNHHWLFSQTEKAPVEMMV